MYLMDRSEEADEYYYHTNGGDHYDDVNEIDDEDDEVLNDKGATEIGCYGMPDSGKNVPKIHKSQSEACIQLDWSHVTEKKYSKLGPGHPTPGKNGLVHSLSDKDLVSKIRVVSVNEENSVNGEEIKSTDFVGRRDISNPETVRERSIVSRKGSVRGFKNRVRAGIMTFLATQSGDKQRDFTNLEKGKIVIYTTSMTTVRETFERCTIAKKILQTNMVRYEEKDLFMSEENQKELMERLSTNTVVLPQVFADGIHIGGVERLHNLNEDGELKNIFQNFPKVNFRSACDKCGGYRFVPCTFCHGSKKSLKRNYFTEEFVALRCMQCDENGLLRCDECLDQQE